MGIARCCTRDNWGLFCQWGGAVACVFFIALNLVVIIHYATEMDRVTIVLRCFSILFCLVIALMSIDAVRKWCKSWLTCAWFLSNWATRGFFLVYLGVVAASSYAIERFEEDCTMALPGTPMAKDEKIGQWVDVSRYVSGGLLVFFGLLYVMLSCCGGGADEEQLPQPKWGKANDVEKVDANDAPMPSPTNPIDAEMGAPVVITGHKAEEA
ncbi:hypothetical protein DIPPA_33000 [Diplonema papillatum]|nr:hypothetical protein DIPPA_33000 [Diplonema papillatum]